MKPPVNVVILAAGLGTRMKSKRAKVLHRAGGLTLIEHVVHAAQGITPVENVTVVVGHQADQVRELLTRAGVRFIEQSEQKGTGHAVLACRTLLASKGGLVVVLYGDCPLLSQRTLQELVDRQAASDTAVTLITTRLEDPTG
jgi:bifunctional UDP-N-acetylglucosamine pyrophosphorylase/glucosamine-1-phosphate N-acetyltransferase